MKKHNLRIILFVAILFNTLTGCAAMNGLNDATVTVRVVDDFGEPVSNVHSRLLSLSNYDASRGLTDENGVFSVHLQDIFYEISGRFEKTGYYKSSGMFWHWNEWGGVPPADTNFTVVLKRIIEPVPMIRKNVTAYPPHQGEPFGFDLEVGDWVFPDGKGTIADILIFAEGESSSMSVFSFSLSAEFLGEHNGFYPFHVPLENVPDPLLRSELPPPQIAPEIEYEKTIEHYARSSPTHKWGVSSRDETRRLIFRVRTVVDEEGKIISANYGWATQDLFFATIPGKKTGFSFMYYYNPDPKSRSLEPKEIADRQNKVSPFEGR